MRAFVYGAIVACASAEEDALAMTAKWVEALRVQDNGAPQPDPLCIARYCLPKATACTVDKNCLSGILCTAGCGGVNQTCIFGCTSEYENDKYDTMLKCFFTDHDCMKMPKGETFDTFGSCRSLEAATPLDTWLGEELTQENAMAALSYNEGYWILAKGLSHAYDCFDCQNLWWYPTENSSSLRYEAVYKIHKPDGGERWNFATYLSSPFEYPGRMLFHADDYGGLVHDEDWRILGIDERNGKEPQWVALYYCGGAPGVKENYEGACLVTPDGQLPTDAAEMAKIDAAYAKAGILMECLPDNSAEACAGHPTPPPAKRALLV